MIDSHDCPKTGTPHAWTREREWIERRPEVAGCADTARVRLDVCRHCAQARYRYSPMTTPEEMR